MIAASVVGHDGNSMAGSSASGGQAATATANTLSPGAATHAGPADLCPREKIAHQARSPVLHQLSRFQPSTLADRYGLFMSSTVRFVGEIVQVSVPGGTGRGRKADEAWFDGAVERHGCAAGDRDRLAAERVVAAVAVHAQVGAQVVDGHTVVRPALE